MQRKTPTSTPSSSPQSRKLKHPLLEGHVWDVNRGTLATTGKNGSHVVVPLEEALNPTLHFSLGAVVGQTVNFKAAFEAIDNKIEKLEKEHKAAIEAVAAIAKQEEENRKRQEEEIRKRNHKVASLLEQVIENLQQVVVELKQ
ncbi:hypothetical protein QOT17_004496 [Balamuthia mandrillaris]